jgi:putative peptide zinc metalloprotease protein
VSAAGPRRLLSAASSERLAPELASRHGSAGDRPGLRQDLVIRRQVRAGEVAWVVKNPETVKYYNFEDPEWGLIELFDGTRTRTEIVDEYNTRIPGANIEIALVLDYEEMLRKCELIERSTAERSLALLANARTARQRAAEEKAEGFNPFFLLFHVFDPNRLLNRTVKYVRWIWTPPVVAVWCVVVLWTVGIFIQHWQPIYEGTYELYAFLRKPFVDIIQFFFILSFIGFIHEMSHAYATKIYGGEVHDIGIALLYFTPAFYCDTTDSLLFENKWRSLWVTTAGIYTEGFLCAGATALWVASYPDALLHELAYKTMLFTGVSTIFFNINPLIKIDGYYALSSMLDIPELREESFSYLGAAFQSRVLRLPVEVPVVSRRKRRIYWIYGTLALAYTAVIMRFIGGIFYNLYEKIFPNVAIVLLILTLYRIFRKRVRLATRTLRLFYLDKKELLMATRHRTKILAAAGAFALLFLVPWSRRTLSSEAVLRPASVARIETTEDGFVTAVLVKESDSIERGATLFHISSPEVEAGAAHFAAEEARLVRATSAAREAAASAKVYAAERRYQSAKSALTNEEARRERLSVKSPIAGRVLTPRVQDLEGQFVAAGALLAEVGDCRQLFAELPVSERLLEDLRIGAEVRALAGERPGKPLRGKIARISPATAEHPKTSKGLDEPAAPPNRPDRFIAFAAFDNPGGDLKPGGLVRAKIYGRRASYAARTWKVLSRWIRTIAW